MGVGRGFHWAGGALGVLEVAELRPLCGGGGRKEREGSERVGHTDSRGKILSQTNNKSGPIGLAKQWMDGGSFVLSKSESSLSIFCFVNCFNTS